MTETQSVELQSALEAFESAAAELEHQLVPLDEAALASVLEELTSLASEWDRASEAMAGVGGTVLAELRGFRPELAEVAGEPGHGLELVRAEIDALQLAAESARSTLEAAMTTASEAVALLTDRALAVSATGGALEQPGERLGGDASQQLAGTRNRVVEQTSNTLAVLTDDCVTPTRSCAVSFAESAAVTAGGVCSTLERNRQRLDVDAQRVLDLAESRSRNELQGLGTDVGGTAGRLIAAVTTVSEALQAAGEAKTLLLDGVSLINVGAQTVIDLLDELDELFGGH